MKSRNTVTFSSYRYPEHLPEEKFRSIFDNCIIVDSGLVGRKGENRKWVCDTRKGFADSESLQVVADYFVDILDETGVNQVAIKGFGASLLLGSIITSSYAPVTGCMIRDEAKDYDRKNLVEGNYDTSKPILLVDDILNSGRSSIDAIKSLVKEGWKVKDIYCGFAITFMWGMGLIELAKQGINANNVYKGMEVSI